MTTYSVKIKHIKINLPRECTLSKLIDLDAVKSIGGKKPDIFIDLKCRESRVLILIENTGRPSPEDMKRLSNFINKLNELRITDNKYILVKILHHRGVKSGKTIMYKAASYHRVELLECKKTINLTSLLRKIL